MPAAFRLEGSSMLPVFKPGGAVLAAPGRLRRGDCAVYNYKGSTLLHRVLDISAGGAVLGDDAGRLEPHFVPWCDIKGRALGGPLASGWLGFAYSSLRRRLFSLFYA